MVAFASIQYDFLFVYPKLNSIMPTADSSSYPWLYKLIFEISYGLDFINIELFFRGFLLLGLCGFAVSDTILPMASFYCCIHFGKPLLECVSSYFGGIALGIIAYRTKSIWGGLIIHLGIAWLMEFFGYANSQLQS
ncbi:MAG TPA: CPBP family intramembrane glutamic endopeptidase, partial [Puia sp.]|nr:CPBP family intramembrane glutamic endopeptidase [Puia sp.]